MQTFRSNGVLEVFTDLTSSRRCGLLRHSFKLGVLRSVLDEGLSRLLKAFLLRCRLDFSKKGRLEFSKKGIRASSIMGTPDTVSMINRMCTPFNHPVRAASRAAERQTTASTVRLSYGGSIVTWTSGDDGGNDGGNDDEGEDERLPTFEACSRAIMAAAERMVVLTGQPRSLAVAIAYDECLDIVTAAVDHMDRIGLQGDLSGNLLEVYQSMHIIRELLQPSPPVRRALRF